MPPNPASKPRRLTDPAWNPQIQSLSLRRTSARLMIRRSWHPGPVLPHEYGYCCDFLHAGKSQSSCIQQTILHCQVRCEHCDGPAVWDSVLSLRYLRSRFHRPGANAENRHFRQRSEPASQLRDRPPRRAHASARQRSGRPQSSDTANQPSGGQLVKFRHLHPFRRRLRCMESIGRNALRHVREAFFPHHVRVPAGLPDR